ncbi:MAG: 2-C-methyl-D-erythritol 4-phosphate cytidylyltransferase [Phycisphaeraceae bacterium]|nr:2-C-methyl-D-erythritol 4-phosphate cytidylyltransferase [Phycisphaeraceae bacterium]
MPDLNIALIIPAAGASRRFHDDADSAAAALSSGRSKLDEDLGGRPVLQRTVELFNKLPEVSFIVVAGPADDADFAAFKDRHADKLSLLGATLCKGGKDHRYQTVANALKLVPASCTHVAVHDAARPCASPDLIERTFDAARAGHAAVIPAVDVPDTLKRIDPTWIERANDDPIAAILGQSGSTSKLGRTVVQTIDRANLVAVQTPQVFEVSLLRRAYAQQDLSSTDDAQIVERLGQPVLVVPGESTNIKITRPADLALARSILGFRAPEGRAAHKRF